MGISGALLKGTSSVDEEVGEFCIALSVYVSRGRVCVAVSRMCAMTIAHVEEVLSRWKHNVPGAMLSRGELSWYCRGK